MFIWSILWFCFKIEYIIDTDTKKVFGLFFIPSVCITRSNEDNVGCRQYTLGIIFLSAGIYIHLYRPWFYILSPQGEHLGNRIYPNVVIETIYSVNQTELDEMNELLNQDR